MLYHRSRSPVDLLDQAREHRARAQLHERRHARRQPAAGRHPPSAPATTPAGPAPRSHARACASARRRRWRRPESRGSCAASARSSGASRSSAGFISAQWNGALTASGIARFAPSAFARSPARAHRVRVARDHDLPGRVQVRRRHDLPPSAPPRAQARATPSASSPRIAAIAPSPTGTASCMYRPRRRTVRRASAKDSVPAATCAEYSPRLWPAANDGAHAARLDEPRDRDAHREDRRLRVLRQLQPSSGPSKHSALSGSPSAASASANAVAADRERVGERRAPCPTFCAPCPGNTNAIIGS